MELEQIPITHQMNKNFGLYISKMIQLLMHLRIDVKKDQTQHFQKLLSKKKKSQTFSKTVEEFFNFLLSKDLYDIATKALNKDQDVVTIKVTFTFVCKKTQLSKMAQSWYFRFQQPKQEKSQQKQPNLLELQNTFQQFISFLVKLPLWQQFWGSFEKRKEIKKEYNLSYKIQYNKTPNNNAFQYNRKVQKQLSALGISTLIILQYRNDFIQLFSCLKQQIQKTIIVKEQNPRKKSLYQFYDQQFDITFVSSDTEITNVPNRQMKVVGTVDEQSDQQYQIIINENVDIEAQLFKRELKQIAQEIDIGMQKYF